MSQRLSKADQRIEQDKRTQYGQFYTPEGLAEVICRWCVDDDTEKVMEPSVGNGVFTTLLGKLGYSGSLDMVDIDSDSLGNAIKNTNQYIDDFHTFNESFFDFDPGEKYGCVIGNPPYISSASMSPDQRDNMRSHLASDLPRLSKRSDAYIYFVTRSLQLLRDGGKLGMVIPKTWLTTQYGGKFREYLRESDASVSGVVTFDKRQFHDADVSVCLLLLRKNTSTETALVNVESETTPDEVVSAVEGSETENCVTTRVDFGEKDELIPLIRNTKVGVETPEVPQLGDHEDVNVRAGVRTGYDGWFCVDQPTQVEDKFLRPSYNTSRQITTPQRFEKPNKYIIDFNWYVTRHKIETTEELKQRLDEDGYTGALKYIKEGEKEGVHNRHSTETRDVWCNCGTLHQPDIIHRFQTDTQKYNPLNDSKTILSNLNGVRTDKYKKEYFALLNSWYYRYKMELWGLSGPNTSLKVMSYRIGKIPVPEPCDMSSDQRRKLREAGDNLLRDEYSGGADDVIIDYCGLDEQPQNYRDAEQTLIDTRHTRYIHEKLIKPSV